MSTQQLKAKLYIVARQGLADANRNSPFWSKRDALKSLNTARHL